MIGQFNNNTSAFIINDTFNQPLKEGDIPNSVQTLTFGYDFNQPLKEGDIPNSVQTLTFGYRFNQPLNNLPISVKNITFIGISDSSLDSLPNTIINITLYIIINQITNLPPSINKVQLMDYNSETLYLIRLPYGCMLVDKNNIKIDKFKLTLLI